MLVGLAISIFGIVLEGVLTFFPALYVLVPLFAFSCLVVTKRIVLKNAGGIVMIIASTLLTITVSDLLMRGARVILQNTRPHPYVIFREMPPGKRFLPNKTYQGNYFGDLAAAIGEPQCRQYRPFYFKSDEYGFRNDADNEKSEYNLIILGDSFGFGSGMTQNETFTSLFSNLHGFKTYNLSMDGVSPWEEYVNLVYEYPRLHLQKGATVLWLMFTGNDLDEDYREEMDLAKFPKRSFLERIYVPYRRFKDQSPLRQVIQDSLPRNYVVKKSLPDGRSMLFVKLYVKNRLRDLPDIQKNLNYKLFQKTFESMVKFTREHDLNLVVALIPSSEEVYQWVVEGVSVDQPVQHHVGFSTALSKMCEDSKIPYCDLFPDIKQAADQRYKVSREVLWWLDDSHWNYEGEKIAANTIYDQLLKRNSTVAKEPMP